MLEKVDEKSRQGTRIEEGEEIETGDLATANKGCVRHEKNPPKGVALQKRHGACLRHRQEIREKLEDGIDGKEVQCGRGNEDGCW